MHRLAVLIFLLIVHDKSHTQPTRGTNDQTSKGASTQDPDGADKVRTSRREPRGEGHPGGSDSGGGGQSEGNKDKLSKEVTANHGSVAKDYTGHIEEEEEEIEEEDVDPDVENMDEILEVNYRLPEGKPWKEERYTGDWLYSENYPDLTVDLHWFCPFYINEGAEEQENKREMSDNTECVTIAQLKYLHQHQGSVTDVLLDTFRVTYNPNYFLQDLNVLKYIVSEKVEGNKVIVNVAMNYHSKTKTCEQFVYDVLGEDKVTITKVEKRECKNEDTLLRSIARSEWVWDEDENEEEDFKYEADLDEMDQDEEEEDHTTQTHRYNHHHHSITQNDEQMSELSL